MLITIGDQFGENESEWDRRVYAQVHSSISFLISILLPVIQKRLHELA